MTADRNMPMPFTAPREGKAAQTERERKADAR